ncbi:MAG: tetratricopeptide repeat protein [Gallionella sp.]
MALDTHEQEQIDALKAWWHDNGSSILGMLLIVIVSVGGYRGWNYYQDQQSIKSSVLFQQFIQQMDTGDVDRINDAAIAMRDKFSGSGYSPRAMLLAAGVNEQNGDTSTAKGQLRWVIDHASEEGLKDIARLRMAALLLDEEQYAEAMQQLGATHAPSFDGLYSDLKGDVLLAQGKTDEARSAYNLAYEKLTEDSRYRTIVQIKMDSLGVAE